MAPNLRAVWVGLVALLACARAARADHPLAATYLEGLFRAKPHLASFMGDHRFDGRLPDYSRPALLRREKELAALEKKLKTVRVASLDDQVDALVLRGGIALEQLYLKELREWEWDPRLEDSFPPYSPRAIIDATLATMVRGDFAPEAKRRTAATSLLKALPAFLTRAQASLSSSARHPSKEHLEQAIDANQGRIEFFESELKAFTGPSAEAEAARSQAVAALRAYDAFLKGPLRARADGEWRLGAALYRKKLALALSDSRTPEELVARARAALATARADLVAVAARLHKTLWPREASTPAAAALIPRVKDELVKTHASPEALLEAHVKTLDELRAFVEAKDLLALPSRETLRVLPMPAPRRGSMPFDYVLPAALDRRTPWQGTCFVDPVDPSWNAERTEGYLRRLNAYELHLIVAHEGIPGHHTQAFYAQRQPNALRAVAWNAAMVEGWAVYVWNVLVDAGLGGAENDRFLFFTRRAAVISAMNLILDVELHSGRMTDEEAIRLMVEEGFFDKGMAQRKLAAAKLDATQLAQHFLGDDEIRSLENDHRRQAPGRWSQRAFNEAVIGHGPIAVALLRRYLLGGASGTGGR